MRQFLPILFLFLLSACQKQETIAIQEEEEPQCFILDDFFKEEASTDEPLPFSHETLVEEGSEWLSDDEL